MGAYPETWTQVPFVGSQLGMPRGTGKNLGLSWLLAGSLASPQHPVLLRNHLHRIPGGAPCPCEATRALSPGGQAHSLPWVPGKQQVGFQG